MLSKGRLSACLSFFFYETHNDKYHTAEVWTTNSVGKSNHNSQTTWTGIAYDCNKQDNNNNKKKKKKEIVTFIWVHSSPL